MSWLVDNATTWYVLIGIIALGFGAAWWLHRRPKLLIGVAAGIALIVVLWLLTRLIVTDRKQLELNIHAMRDAVVEGKGDVLLKFFANDFEFQGCKRKSLADGIIRGAKQYKVKDIVLTGFDLEELKERSATMFFLATVYYGEDRYPIACRGIFVKEGADWRLKEVLFYNPLVNQNQPIALPIQCGG